MKISIITVSYNSKGTIKDTIESVTNQTHGDIEYVIVDGKSSDGTVEIVNSYGDKINKFISEPDDGIYYAMNKGIKISSGDIIGILNSDDYYASNKILEKVALEFNKKNIDCVYANLEYIDSIDLSKIIRHWKSKDYQNGLFQRGWHPPHPTFFVKKSIYDKYGLFNTDFKIAADYEIMLRFLERYKIKSSYVDMVFVKMRIGGESNRNIFNIIKANIESYNAWKSNGLKVNMFYFLLKPLSKILQFIK